MTSLAQRNPQAFGVLVTLSGEVLEGSLEGGTPFRFQNR